MTLATEVSIPTPSDDGVPKEEARTAHPPGDRPSPQHHARTAAAVLGPVYRKEAGRRAPSRPQALPCPRLRGEPPRRPGWCATWRREGSRHYRVVRRGPDLPATWTWRMALGVGWTAAVVLYAQAVRP